MTPKAIVLLSGGLDSAVNLTWAIKEYEVVRTLTFDYGQRAAARENERAKEIAQHFGVKHESIVLPYLKAWTSTALVEKSLGLPQLSPKTLDEKEITTASARAVWVPNRNGIFINIAAALAESLDAQVVIVGFNREEGGTFPDNSPYFVKAINQSLSFSTLNHVEVQCKTLDMDKGEIVQFGLKLGLPFHLIWSCYEGDEKMCGACESCLRLKRALGKNAPELLKELAFAN